MLSGPLWAQGAWVPGVGPGPWIYLDQKKYLGPWAPGTLGTLGPLASPTQALFGEIMHTQASEGADDALMSHVHALT